MNENSLLDSCSHNLLPLSVVWRLYVLKKKSGIPIDRVNQLGENSVQLKFVEDQSFFERHWKNWSTPKIRGNPDLTRNVMYCEIGVQNGISAILYKKKTEI